MPKQWLCKIFNKLAILCVAVMLVCANNVKANTFNHMAGEFQHIEHIILGSTNEPDSPLFKEAELILAEIFHDLGYTFELQSITGARSLFWANSGKIDGVSFRVANLDAYQYPNLKRVETPIFTIFQSVISKVPLAVNGWESMANYVIAYERGTRFIEEKLELFKGAIMVSTSSQAMGLVQVGRADFTILNEFTAQKILEENQELLTDLVINQPPITQITLHPYINEQKHPGLADRVAEALATRAVQH